MKIDTDQPVLGKFLNGRYKTIRVLSATVFGHTYITEDTWLANNLQCVVKHLKPQGHHPKRSEICKRQFTNEALILNQLGNHTQIPLLLDCFEDDQGFYLVQELIVGEPLLAKLPSSKHCDKRWSELQCLEFLQNVLCPLEFVHSQGFIHGDLKPSNLLQRAGDGKFVLIDFGAAQFIERPQGKPRVVPIKPSLASVAIPAIGYIPAEQLSGQPCPSSDLYALGMIAIQALTGLNPMELQAEPDSGELNWLSHVSVSNSLARLLNNMVRYDFKNRYQSATDVRAELKRLSIRSEEQGVRKEDLADQLTGESTLLALPTEAEELAQCLHTVSQLPNNANGENQKQRLSDRQVLLQAAAQSQLQMTKGDYAREVAIACLPKVPPLLSGMGAGMATSNAVAISLGLYTLLHATPSNPSLDLLERATQQYQIGNFEKAIALADTIPLESSVYQDAVLAKRRWRLEWNMAATQFKMVQEAFDEQRWQDVLEVARAMPDLNYWQLKVEPFVVAAQPEIELEAQELLKQAYNRAQEKDFRGALALIKQIPKETPTGAGIQPKLLEYTQKQQVKAESSLQKAYLRAAKKEFSQAMKFLAEIPEDTSAYETAQIKMAEYSQKQDFNEQLELQAQLDARLPKEVVKQAQLPKSDAAGGEEAHRSSKPSADLNPGSRLKEVAPKPVRSTGAKR